MRYFLQSAEEATKWEEVDEYTFNHLTEAVGDDGPRYSGNYVVKTDDGHYSFHLVGVPPQTIGVLIRFFDIAPISGSRPDGFVQAPDYVQMEGKRSYIHQMNGDNFYAVSKKAA